MADIELVIKIPEDEYKRVMNGKWAGNPLADYIEYGTPLPKGHGNLIDADELAQEIIDDNQLCVFNSESERIIHDKMVDFAVDRIADAETIIEADTESEEG